jgi:predicted molibdopterin-dependent oxidoreductase YjgC
LSNEDLFLFQALMRDVIGTPHVDVYPKVPGAELVARYGISADSDWTRLDQNSVILVVAGDIEEEAPIWFLRIKAAVRRGATLIVINGRETKLDRYASHRLRIRYGSAPHLLLGLTKLVLRDESAVNGIQALKKNLSSVGPSSTQRLTGIAAQDLRAAE